MASTYAVRNPAAYRKSPRTRAPYYVLGIIKPARNVGTVIEYRPRSPDAGALLTRQTRIVINSRRQAGCRILVNSVAEVSIAPCRIETRT